MGPAAIRQSLLGRLSDPPRAGVAGLSRPAPGHQEAQGTAANVASARTGKMALAGTPLTTAMASTAQCEAGMSRLGGSSLVGQPCWRCSRAAPRRRRQRLLQVGGGLSAVA